MKNIVTLSVVSIFTTLVLVACSGANYSPESHSGSIHNKNFTQGKIHKIIKSVGKKEGWNMTEFKNNALIAEKADGDSSKSVTITFDKHSFDVTPHDSDLEDAIREVLE